MEIYTFYISKSIMSRALVSYTPCFLSFILCADDTKRALHSQNPDLINSHKNKMKSGGYIFIYFYFIILLATDRFENSQPIKRLIRIWKSTDKMLYILPFQRIPFFSLESQVFSLFSSSHHSVHPFLNILNFDIQES